MTQKQALGYPEAQGSSTYAPAGDPSHLCPPHTGAEKKTDYKRGSQTGSHNHLQHNLGLPYFHLLIQGSQV